MSTRSLEQMLLLEIIIMIAGPSIFSFLFVQWSWKCKSIWHISSTTWSAFEFTVSVSVRRFVATPISFFYLWLCTRLYCHLVSYQISWITFLLNVTHLSLYSFMPSSRIAESKEIIKISQRSNWLDMLKK